MRIAVLAHVRHPIAPPFAGGMEAHSWHLADGLACRGHEVTLMASGDSAPYAPDGVHVHSVLDEHYDRRFPWHDWHGTQALNDHLDTAFAELSDTLVAGGFDAIHNNTLHRFPPQLAHAKRLPMVTSLHVPPFAWMRGVVERSVSPWSRFTVTSRQQVPRWWPDGAPADASVLHNGIDPAAWAYGPRGDGSAIWAGRITPNKAPHLAIAAAQRAGIPLTLFGTIEHRDYFEAEVRPHLRGAIRYGGHLQGRGLAREFGSASVLIFTPLWDEPFGLVAIEAMSCGLPVAAFDMGAVAEVVGPAGSLAPAGDVAALATAIGSALDIPRQVPRARVVEQFSLSRMLDEAEVLYQTVAVSARADDGVPARRPDPRYAEPTVLPIVG
ncbi:glycosyltransferase [Roseobacter sp. HKCCA0434]|uniref:glycosyltransferase n=1 Tax=Roseobacter sp. HKCCA0434 TaxID=3079297 RepID=UPI00290594E8|nr:glycosyltransferase [Roseobacter sp. HKCCA0434]